MALLLRSAAFSGWWYLTILLQRTPSWAKRRSSFSAPSSFWNLGLNISIYIAYFPELSSGQRLGQTNARVKERTSAPPPPPQLDPFRRSKVWATVVCLLPLRQPKLTIRGLLSNRLYLHVFFWGHNSHGSPQPAPMVQQHTDFLIWRVLGVVQPFSSNFSKQKPMRESVCNWKMNKLR